MAKKRLDVLMVEQGLADSRQKAQALIMAGQVFIGDRRYDKAGASVDENGTLELVVTDDGVGFAGQNGQIQLPLDLPAAGSRHNRVALNTVYQMLKHLYGPEYGIRITSFENSGTKVTILLPKEDGQHVQNSDRGRRGADAQGPLHTD